MMTLPSYSAMQFNSKGEHLAALYDACLMIVNTYKGSDVLDGVTVNHVTAYDFMNYARQLMWHISEDKI